MEPVLEIRYQVIAYDENGYGDNRSRDFTDGNEAVAYAESLPPNFGAAVYKNITMKPIRIRVFP